MEIPLGVLDRRLIAMGDDGTLAWREVTTALVQAGDLDSLEWIYDLKLT